MKLIAQDLAKHFDSKLRRLISDTADVCEIADLTGADAMKMILSALTFETMWLAVAMEMTEEEYMAMCLLGYRTLAKDLRLQMEQRNETR